ncbi:hypothetical protein L1987_59169 [Smallanthus sonchifolius]|uniref:Uncharacterized protein n=1 Tax=Smallanthus sonchifolius TaxID=185202 RepID=A0ACB9D4Q4_9ASTR|nr:hypothetical protein L1987_59169 [Smallanthus sonchifolius]
MMFLTSCGTMAQEFAAAPAPSPSMESAGMTLQVKIKIKKVEMNPDDKLLVHQEVEYVNPLEISKQRETLTEMESVKLATALTIATVVLTSCGTMAQEFAAAPAPSPSMESAGMALQVPALLAAVVSLVAYLF